MAPNDSDSGNIFNVSNYDETYWENYLAARPKYHTCRFYDRLIGYHDSHSGFYNIAHDVGTGPGQVAGVVAEHFNNVVASDVNETHLNICKVRNAQAKANLCFILSAGENISTNVNPSSADAVYSGEALALMDAETAIDGFAKILKPGGTSAIWYYGRPLFADGNKVQCQKIYDEIVNRLFQKVIQSGRPVRTDQWKRTTDMMASWFDNVRFPEQIWTDVKRYKWNTHGSMTFYDQEACNFTIETSSKIGREEEVVEAIDETMWAESWNMTEVRRFVDVNLPSFQGGIGEDSVVEELFTELQDAMGGENVTRSIAWPIVLLLATRR